MPSRRPPLLFPALALYLLIASGTFLVAKATLREFPPLVLCLLRFTLAAAILWPIARVAGGRVRIAPEDRPWVVLLGALSVPLNQGLFLFGMQWASASHGALLYALTPAFVVLIGVARGERPTLLQIIGVGLAFAGVLTLLLMRGLHFDRHSLLGDLIVLGAVVSWAFYTTLGRKYTLRYGALALTGQTMLAGWLLFLPIGLLSLRGFHPSAVSFGGWAGLAYMAVLTSALSYVIWYWGLAHLKSSSVALLTNLQPLVTAAMAWLILHERLPAGFAVSTALVLGGVWLAQGRVAWGGPRGASDPRPNGRSSP